MATVSSMAAEEKRWKEESDVRTLAEAERIKGDKRRFNAAAKRAKAMADAAMKEANAVKKVASKKVAGVPSATKKKRGGGGARKKSTRKKK